MREKDAIGKLKALRLLYKEARQDFRESQYGLLADAMKVVLVLRSNKKKRKRFLKLIKTKPTEQETASQAWITKAVVTYVMGATTDNARKLAWKRARVLDFLMDRRKVPVENLEDQIQRLGGIEKISKLAADEDPRRPNSVSRDQDQDEDAETLPEVTEKGQEEQGEEKGGQRQEVMHGGKQNADDRRAEAAAGVNRPPDARGSQRANGDGTLRIRIDLKHQEKLGRIKIGTRVKLFGTRIDADGCWLSVREVKRMKKSA